MRFAFEPVGRWIKENVSKLVAAFRQWPAGRRAACEAALLVLLALGLNLIGNGSTSLWDRDEPRYAQCAREMRQSGDWIHPTFNGEPRYHKPVLTYWLINLGVALGGDNTFGNRLPSSLFGAGSMLLVWLLGRRMLGVAAGRIAAFAYLSSPLVIVESKLATTDSPLSFFLTLCFWASWELTRRPSRAWAITLWTSLAAAVLIKGPVAPGLLVAAMLVAWLWAGRPAIAWQRLEWRVGLPIFLGMVAPWYAAIGWVTRGEFFRVALGEQLVARASQKLEAHGGFPGYYVALGLVVFFPWSAFLPMGLRRLWLDRKVDPNMGFLAGWILGPLLVLELFRTKLVHYYLPGMGGCALLAAATLEQVALGSQNLRRWPLGRTALGLLLGIGITASVALVAALFVVPMPLRLPLFLIAAFLGMGALLAANQLQKTDTHRAWPILACGSVASWLVLGGWLLPVLEPLRLTPRVAERMAELGHAEQAVPVLWTYQPPGVIYTLGHPVPVRRDQNWLVEQTRKDGALVFALLEWELEALKKEDRLIVERHGSISGLNIESGKYQTLNLAVIRPAASEASRPAARVALGKNTAVD